MIQGLKAEYVDSVWEAVWAVLHRAFDYSDGAFSGQKVYNGIKNKSMQLWLEVEDGKITSAGITQLVNWPEKKICWVLGFSSDKPRKMEEYLEVVEPWAKHYGCAELRLTGRRGWERRAKSFGFEFRHVEMAKKLGE